MTFKTYARAIDARAYIEARPTLSALTYDIQPVTVDGKRRYQPTFVVEGPAQRAAVEEHGFAAVDSATEITMDDKEAPAMPKAPKPKTLGERAMLASLTITGWAGRATDKAAAEFTAQHYQANADWTRFTKRLIRSEALKAIKAAEAAARATHKRLTLPWSEKDQRILPGPALQEYMADMGKHRDDRDAAVDTLIGEYEALKAEARRELGGLYNEDDYPSSADLQAKFTFDTELTALDTTGDFRVAMGDEERAKLQQQITERTEARLSLAMSDVYRRLHEVVAHMAERLHAYKPKTSDDDRVENPFREATLMNVRDIVDLLPKLNITNDPALDKLAADVRARLLAVDAKELRTDEAKRAEVAAAADDIAAAMAGMM